MNYKKLQVIEKSPVSDSITFYDIYVEALINEVYSETRTNLKLTNNQKESKLELKLSIPIAKNCILHSFEAIKNGEKIVSKVYKKEKGEEKYADSIAQGNNAFLTTINELSENVEVNLGNLEFNQEFQITLFTTQLNFSKDKSILFSYDPLFLPSIGSLNVSSVLNSSVKLNYSAILTTSSPITRLVSLNYENKLKSQYSNNLKLVDLKLTGDDIALNKYKEIDVMFRTVKITKPKLYEEFDPKLNLYTYSINFLFDKYENIKVEDITENINSLSTYDNDDLVKTVDNNPKIQYLEKFDKEVINDYPGNFVFVIDQSGSMRGSPMEIAKESMILFLKWICSNHKK